MGWIVTVAVALATGFPAYAKSAKAGKSKPKMAVQKANRFQANLLTWQQFVSLSSKKQVKYLNDVRALIVYMEGMQNKYDSMVADNTPLEEMKEQVAMFMHMMSILPEAHAADDDGSGDDQPVSEITGRTGGKAAREKAAREAKEKEAAKQASKLAVEPPKPKAPRERISDGSEPAPMSPIDQQNSEAGRKLRKQALQNKAEADTEAAKEPLKKADKEKVKVKPAQTTFMSPESATAAAAAASSVNTVNTTAPARPAIDESSPRIPRWEEGKGWGCPGLDVTWDSSLRTCVRATSDYKPKIKRSTWGGFGPNKEVDGERQPTLYKEGECPIQSSDTVADVPMPDPRHPGMYLCVTHDSWKGMSRNHRKELGAGKRYPDNYYDNKNQKEPDSDDTANVLGDSGYNADGSKINGGATPAVVATGNSGAPPPPAASNPTDTPPKEPKQQPKEEPVAQTCEKPVLACETMSAEEKDKLAKQFSRKGKGTPCIIGGVFSTYEAPKKCKPVTQQLNHKCTKPNQSICDIGVFCLGLVVDDNLTKYMESLPDGNQEKEAIKKQVSNAFVDKKTNEKMVRIHVCEKIKHEETGVDMSVRCNNSLKLHIEGKTSALPTGNHGENYKICNPADIKGDSGRGDQEQWNGLRENARKMYENWCANKDGKNASFAAFFCTECGVIAERIIAANKEAMGDGCVNGEPVKRPGAPPATPATPPAETIQENNEG